MELGTGKLTVDREKPQKYTFIYILIEWLEG